MQRCLFVSSAVFLLAAWGLSSNLRFTTPVTSAAVTLAPNSVKAAQAVLASFDKGQREVATFSYDDKERFNWHFIPRERKGLALNRMNGEQKKEVEKFLSTAMSEIGVKTVGEIRGLEGILREIEGPSRRFSRDPELYHISFFGNPSDSGRWSWRFEGHHLSVNASLDGNKLLSATPLMYGANPAIVASGPKKGLRVLGSLEDLARELINGLDAKQLASAVGKSKPQELQSMQSKHYNGDLPEGLTVKSMSAAQKGLLKKLIREYTKHLRSDIEAEIHKTISGGDEGATHFVWLGGRKPGEGHSYMVHGPGFVISYANFQNNAKHVHAAIRTRAGEFGL